MFNLTYLEEGKRLLTVDSTKETLILVSNHPNLIDVIEKVETNENVIGWFQNGTITLIIKNKRRTENGN